MAEFKQHKSGESKIHGQLYENLYLLSQFYPASKDFHVIFKRDMFVKNNKAAFFQVIYYLLYTLNSELTKERLISWPPYDIKRETKFRMELLKYVNELNTLYDNADIPHIMSSHFISPGGLKFTKFILKLSQLVVYEHLKKTEQSQVLYCPKPSKNTNINKAVLKNLRKKTLSIEQETKQMLKDFESFHHKAQQEALDIDKKLKELNENIRLAKIKNSATKEKFNDQHPVNPSELEERLKSVKQQFAVVQSMYDVFKECDDLISYLNSTDLTLKHCKDQKFPNEVLHLINNCDELNLTNYVQSLNSLLEQYLLEFPYPIESDVERIVEKLQDLTARYVKMEENASEHLKEVEDTLQKMSQLFENFVEVKTPSSKMEEVLAVRLSD